MGLDFYDLVSGAKSSLSILGVLPLRIDLGKLLPILLPKVRNETFKLRILCESDQQLFMHVLTTDTAFMSERLGFEELRELRLRAEGVERAIIKDLGEEEWRRRQEPPKRRRRRQYIRQCHLNISVCFVGVDSKLFWMPVCAGVGSLDEYRVLDKTDPAYRSVKSMYDLYFHDDKGGRFTSRQDDKRPDELLELYQEVLDYSDPEKRPRLRPRGTFPRKCFYNTRYYRPSTWAFVFDRKGRLLLSYRSKEAADNRDKWDKSVGGHVDLSKDRSTDETAAREVIEELIEPKAACEGVRPGEMGRMLYFGHWLPDAGCPDCQRLRNLTSDQWAYYKLRRESIRRRSERELPDGSHAYTHFVTDVFVFVAPEGYSMSSEDILRRTGVESPEDCRDYRLVDIATLKTEMEKEGFGHYTHDMTYIHSKLLDELSQVSIAIRRICSA